MRVEALGKVPKRLDGNDRTGESSGFRNGCLEEAPQGIPTTMAEALPFQKATDPEAATAEACRICESMCGRNKFIFNLGHGVPPEADIAAIEAVTQTVQNCA